MTPAPFSDEQLMAYADGEINEEEAARIERAAASDPAIAQRIAAFRTSRRLAADAFQPLLEEPVPDALLRTVRAKVVQARTVDRKRRLGDRLRGRLFADPRWREWALAASIGAVIAGAAVHGLDQWMDESGETAAIFSGRVGSLLADALASAASGSERRHDEQRLKMRATFFDGHGSLCREFEVETLGQHTYTAIGCHSGGAWSLAFATRSMRAGEDYAPASSHDSLEAYLSGIEAGPPLSAEEEKAALAALARQ